MGGQSAQTGKSYLNRAAHDRPVQRVQCDTPCTVVVSGFEQQADVFLTSASLLTFWFGEKPCRQGDDFMEDDARTGTQSGAEYRHTSPGRHLLFVFSGTGGKRRCCHIQRYCRCRSHRSAGLDETSAAIYHATLVTSVEQLA